MELDEYLRRQAGVISCAQARTAGLSQDAVDRRVADKRWERLHPGVYLAAHHPYSDEARLRAAVLWAGAGAVAHGVSAAWWHDLCPDLPATVEVTVPRRRRPGPRPGVLVRRRNLPDADLVGLRDLWVTDLALTALEAAVTLGPEGAALLDRALQRRARLPAVYRAHCRNLGRRGSAAAARLLCAAADRAASQAERLLVRLLRTAGITGWVLNHPVGDYLLDLAFPAQRIAIEVDGWAWHMTPDRFVHDRQRQNAVVNLGWTILRFTWHDLTTRPQDVITEIHTALSSPLPPDRCLGRTNRDPRGSFSPNDDHTSDPRHGARQHAPYREGERTGYRMVSSLKPLTGRNQAGGRSGGTEQAPDDCSGSVQGHVSRSAPGNGLVLGA